MVAAAACRCSN